MKKLLFSALFLSTCALGFSSCMNGDYDANPLTTNTTKNPIKDEGNGGGGGNVGVATKGQLRFTVDGSQNVIAGSGTNFQILGANDRLIAGGRTDGTSDISLSVYISNYTGPGTYAFSGTQAASTHGTYTVRSFTTGTLETFNSAINTPTGTGTVTVTSDANDEMVGTFSFTAASDKNAGKNVTISNGSFDVVKF